jgi:hypothetical protein
MTAKVPFSLSVSVDVDGGVALVGAKKSFDRYKEGTSKKEGDTSGVVGTEL